MVARTPWVVAVVAVAVGAAACTPAGESRTAPTSPPAARPPVSTSAAPAPSGTGALATFYGQRLGWRSCGEGFECTRLRVPLDYAKPGGDTFALPVVRARSSAGASRIGSLVVNPGGPGGSGVEYVRAIAGSVPGPIASRFDLVGFDPRGVGDSEPAIECISDRELDEYVAAPAGPDQPGEVAIAVAQARRLAAGCARQSGRLLPHVGTRDAARDLDVLRAALGDAKLTYLGKSYGTYLGATYAELFPALIRAAVLDGAVDPSLSGERLNDEQARGFEAALRAALASCAQARTCGATPAEAVRRLDAVLDRVERTPLAAPSAGGRRLTEGTALYGVAAGLYSRATWPVLAVALDRAADGDGSPLLWLADALTDRAPDGRFSNQVEANTAVNCVDHPSPQDVAAYQAEAARAARSAPHFGAAVVWGELPCAFWPARPTNAPHAVTARGAPPILVVGTTGDPATPYRWAVSLARQLTRGVLLTYDSEGHTAFLKGNDCVDDAVTAYLVDLRVPRDGTRCS